jgi:fructose-specific phosphotransferase system IIA component
MKIMDFLNTKAISADLKATTKKAIIEELLELLITAGAIPAKNKDKLVKVLMGREALGSTGIGSGVAIPHGKSADVKEMFASFGISRTGVNFDSLDGEPVYIFFLLIAPEEFAGPHLKALARISRLLKDKYFRDTLKQAKDEKTILKAIMQEDQKRH